MLHDILVDLLPKVDVRVRRQLSEQLGSMQKPPPELLSLLVHDVIEVSGPLLEHANVSDEDLIDVVKVCGDAHRDKISRRRQLTPKVRAALERSRRKDEIKSKPPKEIRRAPEIRAETAPRPEPAPVVETEPAAAPERSVQGEMRLFEDILRAAVDWTWETGRDGEITHLSDPATGAFGRPARALTGLPFADCFSPANASGTSATLQEALDRRRPFRNLEAVTEGAGEEPRSWWLSGVPGFDLGSGRFTGFRGTAQEIPARAALSAAAAPPAAKVRPSAPQPAAHEVVVPPIARNIDKGAAELIQTLSHELRTPLNAILGFSEMIDHESWGPVSEKYHDKTKVILRSAHNLKNAITDVLDVAKIRAGKQHVTPKFFSLAAVLKASLESVRKEAESRKVTLPPLQLARDVPVLNDPEYLERCVIKLLTYVINRAEAGETLWVKARRAPDHKVDIDMPLLGDAASAARMSAASEAKDIILAGDGFSMAFTLSVAADLALAIGGEIRLIAEDDQPTILRLTMGDYPLVMPDTDI